MSRLGLGSAAMARPTGEGHGARRLSDGICRVTSALWLVTRELPPAVVHQLVLRPKAEVHELRDAYQPATAATGRAVGAEAAGAKFGCTRPPVRIGPARPYHPRSGTWSSGSGPACAVMRGYLPGIACRRT